MTLLVALIGSVAVFLISVAILRDALAGDDAVEIDEEVVIHRLNELVVTSR